MTMMVKALLSFVLLLRATVQADDDALVTCGSVIKLRSPQRQSDATYHLFSEDIQMHGGSGQQIVTWLKNEPSRLKALWMVRPKHHTEDGREYPAEPANQKDTCTSAAEPVKCGSIIRLTHLATQTNLHSHGVKSPLSKQQEVTGFGQGDAKGDAGDNWRVECSGKHWKKGASVRLQHVDTGAYLGGSRQATFNSNNCGHGCPVLGHLEAFARKSKDELSVLEADLGMYMHK